MRGEQDLAAAVHEVFRQQGLADPAAEALWPHVAGLVQDVARARQVCAGRPIVLGLCGSQGSGKSTLALVLSAALRTLQDYRVAILSLDDLYLSARARARLARTVHPLLQTRGVPGTHAVKLGRAVIQRLVRTRAGETTWLPRFDKARDEPQPRAAREAAVGPLDVVIFEGWCVGARPESAAALRCAVNALERDEDRQGLWRRYVNEQLAGPYQTLFGTIDLLMLLCAPDFAVVHAWRREQEQRLRARTAPGAARRVMNDAQLERFVMHFERLTRHILQEMPARADLVVRLGTQREFLAVVRRPA